MSDSTAPDAAPEFIGRVRLIEAQPLDTRAEAYAAVHDELARRLAAVPTDASVAARS